MLHTNKQFNLLLSSVLILSGCKYDIYTNNNMHRLNYPVIQICSDEPYGYVTMIIKNKLSTNNILYYDFKKNTKYNKLSYIFLYIIHTSESCIKTALFQNGEPAEYQMTLSLTIKIATENNKSFILNIKTSRSFFDNPSNILSNSIKRNNIRQIIYEEAAEEVINKLFLHSKK